MEKTEMKVAVMTDIRQIRMETRPIPVPKPDEVLVKVACVGICGSDLHYYESGRIGGFVVEPPFVLGHEASGTVVAVGDLVTTHKVGDRVTMEPGRTCGKCEFCRTGRYNLCPDVAFFATPPVDGVFAEYVTHPAGLCFGLPDTVDFLQGALVEPLAVGFHAAQLAAASPGQTAVVFGAGCIGLVTILALQNRGLRNIYCVDVLSSRLQIAKSLGAVPVNSRQESLTEWMVSAGISGFDLAFETSGTEVCAVTAIDNVKKGATIVLIGYSKEGFLRLPTNLMIDKELTLRTIFRYRHVYPSIIDAIDSGTIAPEQIVTHHFDFDELPLAMEESLTNKESVVKAVIQFEP